MSAQPKALFLADVIESDLKSAAHHDDAAAELRRLHAEVERLSWDSIHTCHSECQRPLCKLTRERDALLEALKLAADFLEHSTEFRIGHPGFEQAQAIARAAIAKAEEA